MKMKEILQQLFQHKPLTFHQANEMMLRISEGAYNEHEVSAFMTVYLMRSITLDELMGFRAALLSLALKIDLQQELLLDIVGTGGDGKNTFNISTLACFVAAGAGLKIAKHGNYGASSISGSSNVMEQLGYVFSKDQDMLKRQVEKAGICFMHAPLFHPALKTVAPIRKNLSVRTFFNMLGPVVNPAAPSAQLLGVFNLEMARVYTYLLQQIAPRFTIIHSLDGYDEISLTHDAKIITANGEQIRSPEALAGTRIDPDALSGGSAPQEAARIFTDILQGKGSEAQEKVVTVNAAIGLQCGGLYPRYEDALAAAAESLKSRKALECLKTLIATQ